MLSSTNSILNPVSACISWQILSILSFDENSLTIITFASVAVFESSATIFTLGSIFIFATNSSSLSECPSLFMSLASASARSPFDSW